MGRCRLHASIGGDAPAGGLVALCVDEHLGRNELLLDDYHLSALDGGVLRVFWLKFAGEDLSYDWLRLAGFFIGWLSFRRKEVDVG